MRIGFVGAGAWGTALAVHAVRAGQAVTLWARDPAQAQALTTQRENTRYLPGVPLPAGLAVCSAEAALVQLAQTSDLLVVATPMAALRGTLHTLAGVQAPLAWLCKGFEAPRTPGAAGLLAHQVQLQAAPQLRCGVLSGPSFAAEVARAQPTALVAASPHPQVRDALVAGLHHGALRVYANDDWVGVEVGGAVKNVLAIATGLCDGLALGQNARAALITRGLAEMTRLGLALGARAETFMGLSGLGDLVLTATGDLSRNRQVGQSLAAGRTLAQTLAALGHVAEGVYSARTVVARAAELGVEMPISAAVVAVLDGVCSPAEAVARLMGRQARCETLTPATVTPATACAAVSDAARGSPQLSPPIGA